MRLPGFRTPSVLDGSNDPTAPSDGGVRDAGADPVGEYCVSGNNLTLHFVNNTSDWVTKLTR